MTKRSMTNEESALVSAMCDCGCTVCDVANDDEIEFHHLPTARPGALAMGFPLCKSHHTGKEFPGESIHSSRLIFTGKYGTELELAQKALMRVFEKTIPF